MRTSFELKILAHSLDKAKKTAVAEVGRFLGVPEDEVEDKSLTIINQEEQILTID